MQPYLALIFILLSMYGCTPAIGPMSQTDPDDESGIGGTGMLAQTDHHEDIAVIGAITGFGSIFINGIEIDIPSKTAVSENGKAIPHPNFAIGDVLEVLATPGQKMHEARRIHIRHEVIGPVSRVNKGERSFEIMKQTILMGSLKGPMPQVGQKLKISGFRDNNQQIHASRLTTTRSTKVFLSGTISERKNNTLMVGKMLVTTNQLPTLKIGSLIKVEGELRDGKLFAKTVRPIPTLAFGRQAKHWLVQGFLSKEPTSHLSIAGTRATSKNMQLHKRLARQINKLIQVEIARDPKDVNAPAIISILDGHTLPTGRTIPQAKTPSHPSPQRGTSAPQSSPMHPNRFAPNTIRRF